MYQHILVPLDGSATSDRGLQEAVRLATEQKGKQRLLHVIDDFPMLVEVPVISSFEAPMREIREHSEVLLARRARPPRRQASRPNQSCAK